MADTSIINNARPKPAEWDEYDKDGKWIGLSDAEFHGPYARPREGGGDAVATTTGTAPAPAAEAPAADQEGGPRLGEDTKYGEVPEYQPPQSSGGIMDWLSGVFSKSQDPIWPTSNRIGEDTLNDVRGQDTFTPPPVASTPGLDEAQAGLARAPNTEYGKVLPYAEDTETGEKRWAMPDMARDYLKGLLDLISGPTTGYMSPEATTVLAQRALTTPPGEAGTLYVAGGPRRQMSEAQIAAKSERLAAKAEQQRQVSIQAVIDATNARPPGVSRFGRQALEDAIEQTQKPSIINGRAPPADLSDMPIIQQILRGGQRDPTVGVDPINTVSTSIPTAKPKAGVPYIDPHTISTSNIGLDAMRRAPDTFAKNTALLRDATYKGGDHDGKPLFPDLPLNGLTDPDEIAEATINHMVGNLLFLHKKMVEQFGAEAVERASHWYDGAHDIVHDMAAKSGYEPRQIAAAIAVLSPQKDWYMNVEMVKRILDVTSRDPEVSPQMREWLAPYIESQLAEKIKKTMAGDPEKAARYLADHEREADQRRMMLAAMKPGLRYSMINDDDARALFIRAHDETHNPKSYPTLTPEGYDDKLATNLNGMPSAITWGSMDEIKKAILALRATDLPTVSRLLGAQHKVRSFNNNMIAPNNMERGDSTMDTHAIAADHLRPLGASDPGVAMGLGGTGSKSAATGAKGTYGLHSEAYARAARILDLIPRQMQSIAWEGIRGFFTDIDKRNPRLVADVNAIWQRFRDGEISANDARELVFRRARGGANGENAKLIPPSWLRPRTPEGPTEEPVQ